MCPEKGQLWERASQICWQKAALPQDPSCSFGIRAGTWLAPRGSCSAWSPRRCADRTQLAASNQWLPQTKPSGRETPAGAKHVTRTGMDEMGWDSCATLHARTGMARPPHARGRRGRSGAAEPPSGGSLHLPVLLVPACSPGSGHFVGSVWWICPSRLVGAAVVGEDVGWLIWKYAKVVPSAQASRTL